MLDISRTDSDRRSPIEFLGVPVDALTMSETVSAVRSMVADGSSHQHVCVNAAKLVEIKRNPALAGIIRDCDLVSADGASVVWASRLLRQRLPERVAGIDLFERLVAAAADDGDSVYFLGARREVVDKVIEIFRARHPGLMVAGHHDGYWTEAEEEGLVADIRAARPTYLFLALSSPRKEVWLNEYRHALAIPFVMGVGGSFDVIAGQVGRAPRVVQRAGMEWAWRLGQEPRRMWRRYLFGNAMFIAMVLTEMVRCRRIATAKGQRRVRGGKSAHERVQALGS